MVTLESMGSGRTLIVLQINYASDDIVDYGERCGLPTQSHQMLRMFHANLVKSVIIKPRLNDDAYRDATWMLSEHALIADRVGSMHKCIYVSKGIAW